MYAVEKKKAKMQWVLPAVEAWHVGGKMGWDGMAWHAYLT